MIGYKKKFTATNLPKTVSYTDACITNVVDTNSPSQCCMQYNCSYTIRDPTCVASNLLCEQQKQAAFGALGSIGEALSATYAIYTEFKASATMAELQVSAKQAEIASIQQELNIIASGLQSAQLGYQIIVKDFHTVYEQTKSKVPLIQLFEDYGASQLLQVQSATYNVTVTTETPIAFPVLLTYNKPYAAQGDQLTVVINFEAPKDLTKRSLAEDLVSQFTEGGGRKKRQAIGSSDLVTTFQRSCTDLFNLQDYFGQLLTAVNRTQNEMETATSVIAAVSNMTETAFSSFGSSGGNMTIGSTALDALQSLSEQREEAAYSEWQTSMGLLHNGTASVGGYECFGFTDCLHTSLTVLQRILTDTPIDEARELLAELQNIREDVEELGVSKNLTIDDAETGLQQVADIINRTNQLNYWCAGLPEFTAHSPGEVNISLSSTLTLVTTVKSELPTRYRWKRNGIILSGHHLSTLTLPNIRMVDAGEYVCLATTDKGTVSSLSSVVNVYYAPVFNRTLTRATVREGADNGVNFGCDAHSWPPPGWSWNFRPNSSVEWQQISNVDSNLLPLLDPKLNQEGWYRCRASNWIGHGYRDAFLTILPATVVRINYPVNVKLMETDEEVENNETEEIATSGSGTREQVIPTFGYSLNHSLTVQLSLITTRVEDAVYRKQDNMELGLNFNFLTPDFDFDNLPDMSVEDVLQVAGPSMMNLEAAKARLEFTMEENGLYVDHDDTRYRTVNSTLNFGTRAFVCPVGYGLDPSLVLCVSCAPGTYNGPPRITMTEVGERMFIQEAMAQCLDCPVGTYQEGKGTSECTQCPQYTSTRSAGARTARECIDFCEVGYFSSTGLQPCQQCPQDYYQLDRGATDCLPCTNTTSEAVCPRPTPTTTPIMNNTGDDKTKIIIIASSAAGGLAVLLVVSVIIIVAIVLWRKKVMYNVEKSKGDMGNILYNVHDSSINNPAFPKENTNKKLKFKDPQSRFSMGMADINPLSQLPPVDIGEPLGNEGETVVSVEEEEHEIDIDDPNPEFMEDSDNKVLY